MMLYRKKMKKLNQTKRNQKKVEMRNQKAEPEYKVVKQKETVNNELYPFSSSWSACLEVLVNEFLWLLLLSRWAAPCRLIWIGLSL